MGEKTTSTKEFYPHRRRLPDERPSITHKFSVGSHEGYITVGLFEDGQPGEVFITMSKEGSTISGFMDAFATSISMALQYGVPLTVLVNKFAHMRFEPSGLTGNPQIPVAKSVIDYIFRWLGYKFLPEEALAQVMLEPQINIQGTPDIHRVPDEIHDKGETFVFVNDPETPSCPECGSVMATGSSRFKCMNCGNITEKIELKK